MNASAHVAKYLSPTTQAAFKAKASEDEAEKPATDDKPKVPASPQAVLLRRIRKIVFGPSVQDLATALDRFNAIVSSLDDSEDDDDDKPQAPKSSDNAKE
jgi:hypothetical protein